MADMASPAGDDALAALRGRVAAIVRALSETPAPAAGPAAVAPRAGRDALSALVARTAIRHGVSVSIPPTASSRPVSPPSAATGAAADAQTMQFFKRTWSRLSVDQRLAQSRAALPGNAGPLNSHHLLHRALVRLRELSPEYLEHLVGHIDALQWLEQANEAAARR